MTTTRKPGPTFKGDTSYPLTEAEIDTYLSRIEFGAGFSLEEQEQVKEALKTTLNTPTGRMAAREAIASGETFKFQGVASPGADMTTYDYPIPFMPTTIGRRIGAFDGDPHKAGANVAHEMMHVQQNAFLKLFRSRISSDASTQAFSAQMALDTLYTSNGKKDIGVDPVYRATFDAEYRNALAYAQGTGKCPDGADKFVPHPSLSGKELEWTQKNYAYQTAAKRAMERYEDTFNTPLEDWRPGEHIISRDIAETRSIYAGQDADGEAGKEHYQKLLDNNNHLIDNNNTHFSPEYANTISKYAHQEADAVGRDTPLGKTLLKAAGKLKRKPPKLSAQEVGVLQYATSQQQPDLNDHYRTAGVLAGCRNYDARLSNARKANDPVRDQLMLEAQKRTGNPYITPTAEQEAQIRAGKPLTRTGRQPTEETEEKGRGGATTTLRNAQQQQPEQTGQRRNRGSSR